MGRKHSWRPVKRAKDIATAAVSQKKPQPLLALIAPPADNESASTALLPFDSSKLAARTAAGLARPHAQLIDLLTSGVFAALDSVACARLACVTRVLRSLAEAMAADRVQSSLRGSCLLCDAVAPRKSPFLTLSHLESFVDSPFLFDATRDLMKLFYETDTDRQGHTGVLLEVPGDEEKLLDTILSLVFPDVAEQTQKKESALALLTALLFHFRVPQERWSIAMLKSLTKRCGKAPSPQNVSMGSSLEMFMYGVGELMPVTKTGLKASKSLGCRITQATLLCQFLERLLATADLVLHMSCPVDAGALVPVDSTNEQSPEEVSATSAEQSAYKPSATRAAAATAAAIAQAAQSQEFLHTLRTLEAEALPPDSRVLDLWALQTAGRYYVILLE